VDTVGNGTVTTYDVRVTRPNKEPSVDVAAMHSLEHLIATYLRNDPDWKDEVVYWGPMGCLTGFYLILKGNRPPQAICDLILRAFRSVEDAQSVPGATAKNCGSYLMHNLGMHRTEAFEKFDMRNFALEQKAAGTIRHLGFSFHSTAEELDAILQAHPEAEFVQLQINYADWENPGVQSRRNWEICKEYGKPVTVMEPVKGGILADPIDTVKAIFDRENNGMSYSSWALRFVASKDNLLAVLSGMSSLEQMEDNLSFMKDFRPLDAHEEEVIREAQEALNRDQSIACTACHYCTKGCPMSIPIPEIFAVENRKKGSPEFRTKREYTIVTAGRGKASDCIQCGQCEAACPQHLPIISLLEQCRSME
jgi:predicted aldo/keto reductase-like oxidoreductase